MTKKEMITAIQVAEAKAWKEFKSKKALYGGDDSITKGARREWRALFELQEQLGIKGLPVKQLVEMDLLAM
jgi:hypothetical protein